MSDIDDATREHAEEVAKEHAEEVAKQHAEEAAKEAYDDAYKEAYDEAYKEAYEEATEMIVAYVELHPGEQLKALCVEIDPENWNALRNRVQRAQGNRKSVSGANPASAQSKRKVKRVLRETPEIVEELEPDEQRKVAKALDTAAAKREHKRKQEAKAKEREHLGDETVDDLELKEQLQSTEYLLISARGSLRGFVRQTGEIGTENTPEEWRESCLEWIEDLRGHLGMAEALLAGDSIDWTAFEDMLEKEAN